MSGNSRNLQFKPHSMQDNLHDYRKNYSKGILDESTVDPNPMQQFRTWFHQVADSGGVDEVNAVTLSTLGEDGFPRGRVVLLKKYDEHGFYFYTNYNSHKGASMRAHPQVSLSFFWPNMERQVIILGRAEQTTRAQSEQYFATRPRGSQLGAWVSKQSSVIPDRAVLEDELERLEATYQDKEVPTPDHWGGVLVRPHSIEFWQGRPNRLHDRIRYSLQGMDWIIERLAP